VWRQNKEKDSVDMSPQATANQLIAAKSPPQTPNTPFPEGIKDRRNLAPDSGSMTAG
jgi:hypothetical protein